MTGREPSHAPFGGQSPHFVHEVLGYAVWFTDPPGVLGQMLWPRRVDFALVELITGPLHTAVRSIAGPGRRTHALHDWSLATGYEPSTRQALTSWLIEHRRELAALATVAPLHDHLIRAGAQVARTVLLLAGTELRFYDSLGDAVAKLGLRRFDGEVVVPVAGSVASRAR